MYGGYGGYEGGRGGYYPRRGYPAEGDRYGGGGYGGGGYAGGYGAAESSGSEFDADLSPEGKAAANAIRGYIVTIRGTTPNKTKGRFVESGFLQELLKYTAEQQLKLGKSWYVARAEMVQVGPRDLKNQPQAEDFEENAELNGEVVIQLDKNGKSIYDPKKDRVFPDETIANDTQFVVLAIIALDPDKAPQDPNKKTPATPK
jgi:hypothetical protein